MPFTKSLYRLRTKFSQTGNKPSGENISFLSIEEIHIDRYPKQSLTQFIGYLFAIQHPLAILLGSHHNGGGLHLHFRHDFLDVGFTVFMMVGEAKSLDYLIFFAKVSPQRGIIGYTGE